MLASPVLRARLSFEFRRIHNSACVRPVNIVPTPIMAQTPLIVTTSAGVME
jgi:hypothetical protein